MISYVMHNTAVETKLNDCFEDLIKVEAIIEKNHLAPSVKYLTCYAVIKVCSTIEHCFKQLIADKLEVVAPAMSYYINNKVRTSSANPRCDTMSNFLSEYNKSWSQSFKERVKNHADSSRIKESLASLVNTRNTFAHTGNCPCTFSDVSNYYVDAIEFLKIIDDILR